MTSLILKTASRIIIPLGLLYAAYVTLKGHNAPGGGFIGGLIFAVTFILLRLAFGPDAFNRMIPLHPRVLVFIGLAMALLTSIIPMLFGVPLLTSHVQTIYLPFNNEIHFVSAQFFDFGVMFVVIGVSIGMISRLSEELEH